MHLILIISLLISSIDAIIISQVHRSSLFFTNSSCALLSNVTLPADASIQSCIWQCAHQDQCRTAVYYQDNRTCLLFSEDCQSGNITSSGDVRASVICYRRNQGSNNQCSPRGWTKTGYMHVARRLPIASVLSNGKVLVTGGFNGGIPQNSAELYDPSTGNWTMTRSMSVARSSHTASILSNGKVLVTGGISLNSAELYDPPAGTWSMTGNMSVARSSHAAAILSDGKVLVTGGFNNSTSQNSAELYDPSAGTWSMTGNMSVARGYHAASMLSNGTVLVTGGYDGGNYLNSAELYDPLTGIWTMTGNMSVARGYHAAAILLNKTVLVIGGCCPLDSAELY
ncbi:unnamed protein product [Adineta ricciae]|uniref:Apple domain-containing protein n=1 Tax=Adineta ricciae TaxID=249248 RepID=A0A815ZLR3_ADIRI|nr:unnamed protein product [Adineta ricciae]